MPIYDNLPPDAPIHEIVAMFFEKRVTKAGVSRVYQVVGRGANKGHKLKPVSWDTVHQAIRAGGPVVINQPIPPIP
jgi:hypothetical protein